jgi:two-component system, OmpR family, response regulator AdeR
VTASAAAGRRVLVVEDDRVVAETLRAYLEHAGYRVEVVHDGSAALAAAAAEPPALVVLDLLLPGLDGREVCRRLRERSTVPVLMLTARTTEQDVVAGLEVGADDYVGKPFSPREVVARVRALLRRAPEGAERPPEPLRLGELEVDLWSRVARVSGRPVALTPGELRLLEALARQPGRAFTREELLARAFGPDAASLERTVDSHVANLRRKLEAAGAGGCVLTVPGIGYRLARPEERA